ECPATAAFIAPTVTDACDPNVVINFTDTPTLDACGLGTVTRTWTAVDCAGNAATPVSQTITIDDTTAPVLSGQGADATIECPATPVFTDPTVSDACDPNVTITSSDISNLDACGLGTVTRTWTALDCAGNAATPVTQTITIEDTTPPVLTGQGPDVTIECPASTAFIAPIVTDACDPNVIISSSDVSNLDP